MQVYGKNYWMCVFSVHGTYLSGGSVRWVTFERNENNIIAGELCVIKNSQHRREREQEIHQYNDGANHLNDNTESTNGLTTHFKFSIWSLAFHAFFHFTLCNHYHNNNKTKPNLARAQHNTMKRNNCVEAERMKYHYNLFCTANARLKLDTFTG